jgi:hypothetical protein
MEAGDAPIVIKSDPQMVGDIGSQVPDYGYVLCESKRRDAAGGTYQIPLNISYTQYSRIDQFGLDTLRYYYLPYNVTITVPLSIKSEVIPEVVSATSNRWSLVQQGYVNLTIKNVGSLDGSKATVQIIQDTGSPVSPVDTSVYVGDFPAGRYGVLPVQGCGGRAMLSTRPIPSMSSWSTRTMKAILLITTTQTVGVDVGNKVDFAILSSPIQMSPGSRKTIQVEYQNTGDSTIKSAEARISVVTPFTSSSDIAYLGDLAPGQTCSGYVPD